MSKSKLPIISLLSLLVVLAPVSSVLANTEPVVKEPEKPDEKVVESYSVFTELEEVGGDAVDDERLGKEEGEGFFGAIIGGIIGLGVGIAHGIANGHGPARMARDTFISVTAGVGAGAAVPEP